MRTTTSQRVHSGLQIRNQLPSSLAFTVCPTPSNPLQQVLLYSLPNVFRIWVISWALLLPHPRTPIHSYLSAPSLTAITHCTCQPEESFENSYHIVCLHCSWKSSEDSPTLLPIILGFKFPLQGARLLESGPALSDISLCLSQTNLCWFTEVFT